MKYFNALYMVRGKRNVVSPNMGFAKELIAFEKEVEKSTQVNSTAVVFSGQSSAS